MLVGGAELFADGIASSHRADSRAAAIWRERNPRRRSGRFQSLRRQLSDVLATVRDWTKLLHDKILGTTNVIVRDAAGNIASAVSTSGWGFKWPGRVGDSPIIGAGNYADNRYGAAACTGRGEMAMRAATAYSIVRYMRDGLALDAALSRAMLDLRDLVDPFAERVNVMNAVAMDRDGAVGAISTAADTFYVFQTLECPTRGATARQRPAQGPATVNGQPPDARAAIQNGPSEIEVREIAAPDRDGALVRVVAAGVCGSDLHEYLQRSQPQSVPDGHEVAGEVVALPNAYAGPIRVGDLVAVDTICHGRACGACVFCRTGQTFHCLSVPQRQVGVALSPTLSSGTPPVVPGLPPGMSAEQGALVEPLAGVHALRRARMTPAQRWSSSAQARSVSRPPCRPGTGSRPGLRRGASRASRRRRPGRLAQRPRCRPRGRRGVVDTRPHRRGGSRPCRRGSWAARGVTRTGVATGATTGQPRRARHLSATG
jgi:beta-aspartyl-peptidase (threonine type)